MGNEYRLKFSDENEGLLRNMMEMTGIATPEELFAEAFTQMYWSLKRVKEGRVIAALDEETGKYREYRPPYIQRVMDKAKKPGQLPEEFHSPELERLIADLDPDPPKNKEPGRGR